jgi:hypothetical protein
MAFVVRQAGMSLHDVKGMDVADFFTLYQSIEEDAKKKA